MALSRITQHEADEVERLKGLGRTNRQIEKIVGLTSGLLSRPYTIGDDARPIMDRHPFGSCWRYPIEPKEGDR